MSWTEPYARTTGSIGTTEYSIVNNSTTLAADTTKGIYQLWLDPVTNLAKADRFLVRYYDKVRASGGTQRVIFEATIYNAQSENWAFPPLPLGHGWDMSLKKLAGTDRAFDLSVRKIGTWTNEFELSAATISTTEFSILNNGTTLQTNTTKGVRWVFVDGIANMVKADEFEFRVMEAVKSAGTKRQLIGQRIQDVQSEVLVTPALWLGNGWDATLKRIAGADRAMDASIRKAA